MSQDAIPERYTEAGIRAWGAEDWSLFSSMRGSHEAARRLNDAALEARGVFLDAIQAGDSVDAATTKAWAYLESALDKEAVFGAADTEPAVEGQAFVFYVVQEYLGREPRAKEVWPLWRMV